MFVLPYLTPGYGAKSLIIHHAVICCKPVNSVSREEPVNSSLPPLLISLTHPLSLLVLPPSLHFPRLVCLINRPSLSFISLPVWLTYLLLLFPLSLHSLFTFIILHLCHAQWSKVKDTDVEVKLHRLEMWASVTHLTQQTTAEE